MSRRTRVLAALAALALVACALGFWREPALAYPAWLAAISFWTGVSVGALSLQLMLSLVGGRWEAALQPSLASVSACVPWMGILFIPVLAGLGAIYPWAHSASLGVWLAAPAFVARAVALFAGWSGLAWFLQRRPPDLAAAALAALLQITAVTVASIDWSVSLQLGYATSASGLAALVDGMLGAMALVVLAHRPGFAGQREAGGVLLMLVLAWSYLTFIDFLTAWSADLPREVAWYLPRVQTSWASLALAMALLQAALPLTALLWARVRGGPALRVVAALVVAGNIAEALWRIRPAQSPGGISLGAFDLAAFVGIGLCWFIVFDHGRRRRARGAAPPRRAGQLPSGARA